MVLVALRQQVSKYTHPHKHTHTNTHAPAHSLSLIHTSYRVHCNLLSPARVMILLYLHGFSYIDLGQEEAPPVGAPFLAAPHPVTIVPECACVQNTSSWCVNIGCVEFFLFYFILKRTNELRNPDLLCTRQFSNIYVSYENRSTDAHIYGALGI